MANLRGRVRIIKVFRIIFFFIVVTKYPIIRFKISGLGKLSKWILAHLIDEDGLYLLQIKRFSSNHHIFIPDKPAKYKKSQKLIRFQ